MTTTTATLAELARLEAEGHPPRTPGRRAACHLWVSLTIPAATSIEAARRAIASFGDQRTQAAALGLLDRLTTRTHDNANQGGSDDT